MAQESINVKIMRFDREKASDEFTPHLAREYDTIINLDGYVELPIHILDRDTKGNTLSYIGCIVERNAPAAAKIAQDIVDAPARKQRSVVAKKTAAAKATAPITEVEAPAPKPKPQTIKKPAAPAKPVRPATPVAETVKAPTPKPVKTAAPAKAKTVKAVPVTTEPVAKPAKKKRETVDLSAALDWISKL
jgi:hypothetical protein